MNRRHTNTWALPLALSLVCSLSIWVAMLSWRPLTEDATTFLSPLLVGSLVLAVSGAVQRWAGVPGLIVIPIQVALGVWVLLWAVTGSLLPSGDAVASTVEALRTAVAGAERFSVPVPVTPSPVAPLFLAVGLGTVVVADTFALTLRRAPVAAVPLLVVLLVPTNLAGQLDPWVFLGVAVGFLALLRLDRIRVVSDWGRDVANASGPSWGGPSAGATLGLGATALICAVVAGAVVPVADLGLIDRAGPGAGSGGDQVNITNPLIDMRRNLSRGADVPLLEVESPTRRPSYLATTVLADFNGREWTSGDRNATASQRANGQSTPPPGVNSAVPSTEHPMEFRARPAFHSRWLVLPQHATRVNAEGDWRRDNETQDYVAWSNDMTTAGLSWSATEMELDLDELTLDRTNTRESAVASRYSELPDSLPDEVRRWADEVTAGAETPFRKARALQAWFRSEFTYSLEQVEAVGNDELVEFLAEGGREGYCEQFAGAMAVMARALDIPSRVMVGLLSPEQVEPGVWEFSAHDLHAWPELYFPGSGWVRFEPTPAARTSSPPNYTVQQLPEINGPDESSAPSPVPEGEEPEQELDPEDTTENAVSDPAGESFSWAAALWALSGLLLVAGIAFGLALPGLVRRRRRSRRSASGTAEDLWAELRDEALDLGLAWPDGRSPRDVGHVLEAQLVSAGGTPPSDALRRVVAAVEHSRYARPGAVSTLEAPLVDDVAECVEALRATAGSSVSRRARWWPRSVLASGGKSRTQ